MTPADEIARVAHSLEAAFGPILKDAFPKEHRITRFQVAQALAGAVAGKIVAEFERLRAPRFGEAGYSPPPQPTHDYEPHSRWPWFCGKCGYPEHERLMHPAPSAHLQEQGR